MKTRFYVSNLQATNTANTGSFTNDISYVVMGDDQGAMCATVASMAEKPALCGLYSKLEREWKVTKTNFTQTFNTDFNLAACANTGLVDDDGNFANGGTACYYNGDGTGIVISYSGTTVTVSNISNTHIPNNSTMYVTLGSVNVLTPLPINLTSFTSDCDDKGTVISWVTASESNNDYFTVEKSNDGISFYEIAKINGAENSSSELTYQYTDLDQNFGVTYYRLKQTDFDGGNDFFQIIKVNCKSNGNLILFPNPANELIIIQGVNIDASLCRVYNVLGQDLTSVIQFEVHSENRIELIIEDLVAGTYYVSVGVEIIKFIKE